MNDPTLAVDPTVELVLEQRVLNGPDGDAAYWVTISGGRIHFSPNGTPADAILTLDYPTARALATRELSAQDAFLHGRVRVTGNVARIQSAANALAALAEAFAAAGTTY